jgi:Flp pilus assembly protein TadG
MKTTPVSRIGSHILRSALDMFRDRSGIAATEFAVIVPLMLVMFFGVVEFSQGVAVDRKVTMVARTLSDLTSQAPSSAPQATQATVDDTYVQNVFTASIAMFQPYVATPTNAQISEIYVDSTGNAKIQWSKAATIGSNATQATLTASSRGAGDDVTSLVPSALLVKKTYLIWSEVSYRYVPTIGYVMTPTGVLLSDSAFTRPRQVVCVVYNNLPALVAGSCPLT